jgi:hypothetical protein
MNLDFALSVVRALLQAGGAILISKGIGDQVAIDAIIGGALSAGGLLWSYFAHKPKPPAG